MLHDKLSAISQTTDPRVKAKLIAELIAELPAKEDHEVLIDFTSLFEVWDESSDDRVKAAIADVLLTNDAAGFELLRKTDDSAEMGKVQEILCAAATAERLSAIIDALMERLEEEDCYDSEAVAYFYALRPLLTEYPEQEDDLRELLEMFIDKGHVDSDELPESEEETAE